MALNRAMKHGLIAAALAVLCLPASMHAAHGENCNKPLQSTYEHAVCEERNEHVARVGMNRDLNRALTAATALHDIMFNDFRPYIKRTQELWSRWADAQCELEADAIMGSASAFVVHVCRRELNEARTQSLNVLAQQLEALR